MKTYNKLVRDNIPSIIEKDGKRCRIKVLDAEEYKKYAFLKLIEEANEASDSKTLEELADLEEVVLAAASSIGFTKDDLEKARLSKKEKNGGFDKKIFLIDVE